MKESQSEILLAQFLKDFDAGDKRAIARQMVMELNLEENGEKFSVQLSKKLNRELTQREIFIVDALQKVLLLDPTKMFDF